MRTVLVTLLIFITAFGQTKTRKVGTKSLKDIPAREITDGNQKLRSGSYSKALSHYEAAIAALEGYKAAKDDEKPEKYRDAKMVDKYLVIASYSAGKAAGKSSNRKAAEKHFNNATKLGKESTKAWYEYGAYLFDVNRMSQAKNAMLNVVKIGEANLPKQTSSKAKKRTKRDMAFAYYKLGDIESGKKASKAIAYYEKAVDLRPNYYQPLIKMTKLHEEAKSWKKMLTSSNDLIKVLNKSKKKVKRKQLPKALLFKGMAEYNLKNYKAASKTLAQISNLKKVKN